MLNFQGVYCCWWFRNPANQLSLVVYPIIYDQFCISQMVVWDFWSINSIISYLTKPPTQGYSNTISKIWFAVKMIGKQGSPTTSLRGIPGPLRVEFVKVYRGPFMKMNRLYIISLLVGGGYPQHISYGFFCDSTQKTSEGFTWLHKGLPGIEVAGQDLHGGGPAPGQAAMRGSFKCPSQAIKRHLKKWRKITPPWMEMWFLLKKDGISSVFRFINCMCLL